MSLSHIHISGTVLAALLCECANAHGDLEGSLMGTVAKSGEKTFLIIEGFRLYRPDKEDTVVGYFKFRRQTVLALSAREHLEFMQQQEQQQTTLIRCLAILTSSLTVQDDSSTHAYDYAFWDTQTREKLPVQIVNLTELAYQQFVSSTPSSIMPAVRTSALMDTFDSIYFHAMKKLEDATYKVIQKEKELEKLQREIKKLEQ